ASNAWVAGRMVCGRRGFAASGRLRWWLAGRVEERLLLGDGHGHYRPGRAEPADRRVWCVGGVRAGEDADAHAGFGSAAGAGLALQPDAWGGIDDLAQ